MPSQTTPLSLHHLLKTLNARSARAQLSQIAPRSAALRAFLEHEYLKPPGQGQSFLADPVIESRFGWQNAAPRMKDLAGNLLHPRLVDAMDKAPDKDQRFDRCLHPFSHQLEAWKALREEPARSVLVSSGTGSGKTECFLVPILDDLVRQVETSGGRPLVGIRALFLYPLNALINSQRDRLNAWTRNMGGDIRFCLYNGETPGHRTKVDGQQSPALVLDRTTLRQSPPPIVVTNTTMLEYMLVRQVDAPILQASRGKLRWIVIDEAHTYLGSQAAELSLLLRRVMNAFHVSPKDVRFVATSATLASDGDSQEDLARFLTDLAGSKKDRTLVIMGHRSVPSLPNVARSDTVPPLEHIRALASDSGALFDELSRCNATRALRSALSNAPYSSLRRLADIFRRHGGTPDQLPEILDHCSQAQKEGERFLPLRAHLFHRTSSGLWACCNRRCQGRSSHLQKEYWAFGKVFFSRRDRCDTCKSLVFEVLLCRDCGEAYLAGEIEHDTTGPRLRPVQVPISDLHGSGEEEWEEEDEGSSSTRTLYRLITSRSRDVKAELIDAETGELDAGETVVHLIISESARNRGISWMACACCGAREYHFGSRFKPVRTGAPFFLGTAIPTLLEHLPKGDHPDGASQPAQGRRLITFSDSRQGTARFALRTQLEAERNYVRTWIFHHVLANRRKGHSVDTEVLTRQITDLELAVATSPSLMSVLEEFRAKLRSAEVPSHGELSWKRAADDLKRDPVVREWLIPSLKEQTLGRLSSDELAQLLLLRELLRRPMRPNSLETLGLVGLDYPYFRTLELPASFSSRSLTQDDWHDFLCLCVDFFVRSNALIDAGDIIRPWLERVFFKSLVGPGRELRDDEKHRFRVWPALASKRGRQANPRIVQLLAAGLSLDLNSSEDRVELQQILNDTWLALKKIMLPTGDGYRLSLLQKAHLVEVPKAWYCPISRRLLPKTFRGITPYTGPEASQCRQIKMPQIPAHWRDETDRVMPRHERIDWLENNRDIRELRRLGVWSDLSDRLVIGADYYRVGEHSAQQSGRRLRELERDFKDGKVNLLSCSTTMEMGVDIGGLSMVVMNNVPPGPANFLQRVGRAGRRDEPVAFSFTLCKATPHGQAVFEDPTWAFRTPIHVPRVSLESARIVVRHVHAIFLASFLSTASSDVSSERLTAGWFFIKPSPTDTSPSEIFRHWLGQGALDQDLDAGLRRLVRGTSLEDQGPGKIMADAADQMEKLERGFREEVANLQEDLRTAVQPRSRTKTPEQKAIEIQLKRFLDVYLLAELAQRGFLPGYGFPTQVVPFIHTTSKHFAAERRRSEAESTHQREDNRARSRDYPSRQLATALRDYAPGNEIVLDGRIYESQGVTLNWQIPAGDDLRREPQAFRWVWRCRQCHSTGTSPTRKTGCSFCGSDNLFQKCFLEPTGFAVGIRYEPHNDVSRNPYIAVEDPWITASGGEWQPAPGNLPGRFRYSNEGSVFHFSRGLKSHGYALCLRCGRAASEPVKVYPEIPALPVAMKGHSKLRRGRKDNGTHLCESDPRHIKRGLWLGAHSWTDVFELEIRAEECESISHRAVYSLAVALREALADLLGVDRREIGCTTPKNQAADEPASYSLVLFDAATGGAGFVGEVPRYLPSLLEKAQGILRCKGASACDRACHSCILTFDSQYQDHLLNRQEALETLDSWIGKKTS